MEKAQNFRKSLEEAKNKLLANQSAKGYVISRVMKTEVEEASKLIKSIDYKLWTDSPANLEALSSQFKCKDL